MQAVQTNWKTRSIKMSQIVANPRLAEQLLKPVPKAEYVAPVILPFPKPTPPKAA